ncbi:MAG: hypothetical protein R3C68_17575 [Myxococcota bacterium]
MSCEDFNFQTEIELLKQLAARVRSSAGDIARLLNGAPKHAPNSKMTGC